MLMRMFRDQERTSLINDIMKNPKHQATIYHFSSFECTWKPTNTQLSFLDIIYYIFNDYFYEISSLTSCSSICEDHWAEKSLCSTSCHTNFLSESQYWIDNPYGVKMSHGKKTSAPLDRSTSVHGSISFPLKTR